MPARRSRRQLLFSALSAGLFAALAAVSSSSAGSAELRPLDGERNPNLVLSDLSGGRVDLSQWRAQVLSVHFFATWCEPCREELCADLNALFVGLSRAVGLPARDVYGIRVAPSKFGHKSLGACSEIITKAQHRRAEVYLSGFGWVPMDPADVRKVVLEEPPGNLAIDDPKVAAARKTLFGAWETNWLAYNFAHDVAPPGSSGGKLGFLMYPQAETAGLRLDCLDPDTFRYTIRAKELTAARAERTRRSPGTPAARDMSDTVLDLRGLRCPQPVLRAAKALRKVPIGGTLVLECTDPLTVIDVPHFVNQTGQALAGHEQRGPLQVFRILKQR